MEDTQSYPDTPTSPTVLRSFVDNVDNIGPNTINRLLTEAADSIEILRSALDEATETLTELKPEQDLNIEWLMDALEAVHHAYGHWRSERDPVQQAARLVELNDRMSDLTTYHPSWDYESGTMGWEREEV